MHPLISIIIPTYNSAKYVEESIDSVLNQNYTNWECLVIDDGSTDNTKEIISGFLKDKRIRYHYQSNSGLSASRNYGLSLAKGDYIQFLDSDDVIFPDKFRIMMEQYKIIPDTVILFSDFEFTLYEHPYEIDSSIAKPYEKISKIGDIDFKKLYWGWDFNFIIPTHAFLFPSSLLNGYKYDVALESKEDWDFYLSLLSQDKLTFNAVDYIGCGYRLRPGSMSQDFTKMIQSSLAVLYKWRSNYLLYITRLSFYFLQLYIKKIRGFSVSYGKVIKNFQRHNPAAYIDLFFAHTVLPLAFTLKILKTIARKL